MDCGRSPEQALDRDSNDQEGHEMNALHIPHSTAAAEPTANAERRAGQPPALLRSVRLRTIMGMSRIDVPLSSARDHLANERVFLAYFRTSSALATFAVVVLQLYRLGHDSPPPGVVSDYNIGIPLASTILIIAMLMMIFIRSLK